MFKPLVKIPKYWTGSGYHDDADEDDDNDNHYSDDGNVDDVDDTQGAGAADCKPARHD